MTVLPRLYAITSERAVVSHVEQAAILARAGVRLIQIRDKSASGRDLVDLARAAIEIAHRYGALLIVNDRVDVAKAAGADGVHLGQDDLPARAAREILGPSAIVGLSTHSSEQAREAALEPVDYVAIGPVFGTTTKENPDPVVGLDGVSAVRALVTTPLVAIGGVTLESAVSVIAAGADSVAVVGDLRVGAADSRVEALIALLGPEH